MPLKASLKQPLRRKKGNKHAEQTGSLPCKRRKVAVACGPILDVSGPGALRQEPSTGSVQSPAVTPGLTSSSRPLPVPAAPSALKLHGFDFFRSIGSPKFCIAPMVNQSELAFRMLCYEYGATLGYTPMFLDHQFATCERYRNMVFQTCAQDHPLIVQFAGNDAATLVQAAQCVQGQCVAVDLNLGCPQDIAFQGRYGAALMDDWDTVHSIVRALHNALRVPVCCKVRVYEDVEQTVAYAKMLQSAGCSLLAVHGRTVAQKASGLAQWGQIRRVVEALDIPVLANGNIRGWEDVQACLRDTKAAGVMSAESLLEDPALFAPGLPGSDRDLGHGDAKALRLARRYLELAARYPPCSPLIIRKHLFHILTKALHRNTDLYDTLVTVKEVGVLAKVVDDVGVRVSKGIECNKPRANGRPRRYNSRGMLYAPAIGGVGAEDKEGLPRRKRKGTA